MMGKKRVVIPVLVIGLLLLALTFAYIERLVIATYAAKDYLAGLGIEDPRLEFTDLTFTHIEVEGVALGGPEGVNARTIRLDFAFLGEGLLPDALDLRQVEIEGLRLQLNLTGQGELLPGLQPLLARTEDEEEARTGLIAFDPLSDDFAVALTDSRLVIQTDQGPINALLDSQIDRDDEGGMKVRVVGGGEGPGGRADGEARLTFQDEALTFAEADLHLSDFALADLDPEALYVSLQADAYSLAVHGDLLLPDAHLGGFALLQSKEAIVPLSEPPGDLYALKTILLDQDWELQGQLSGQNLSHPSVGQGLTFSTSLDLTKEDRTWRLHLPEETKVTVDRLAASLLEGDLPPDLTRFLSNPFEISLSGPKDAPLLFGRGEASATSPLPTSLNIKGDASFLSALAASLKARLFGNLTYDINTPSYHIDITSLIEALHFNIGGYGSGNVGYRGRIEAAPGVLALNGTLEGLDWRAEAEGMPARITTAGTPVRARLKDDTGRLHLGSGLTIEMSDQTLPFDTPTGLVTATLRSMTAKAPLSGPGTLEETLEATAELELAGGALLTSETAVRHAPLQASFTHEGGKTELLLGGASLEFPALGIRLNQPALSAYAKGDDRAVEQTFSSP